MSPLSLSFFFWVNKNKLQDPNFSAAPSTPSLFRPAMEEKDAVVLFPSPAIGHLISMVELGKLFLTYYHPSLSVHILITTPLHSAVRTAPYISRIEAAAATGQGPPITFHRLPTIPAASVNSYSSVHHETRTFELLRLHNPHVRDALVSISRAHRPVRALIMDFFCPTALDVATDLGVPGYFFLTSGAGFLASLLHLPKIHRSTTKSLKDLNEAIEIPGVPPIPPSDMLKPAQDRTDKAYEWFLTTATQVPRSAGIVINTFESLEPRALKALTEGRCVEDGPTPPIFCIGPMIASEDAREGGGSGNDGECLTWLDSQPSRSVVFLCFGSLGRFSAEQTREIAQGLEKSGQRFLWVVRSPPEASPEPDLSSLLPAGFSDRTRGRGLVVKSWAPQVPVLSHGSVGGFVTHCGWNSVLESVCAGVPMAAWPLYAEQRINRVLLVEELKLAVPVNESNDGFVAAAEVERRVIELMDSEAGRAIRERVAEMKDGAKAAMSEGGSSRAALSRLAESWSRF